MANKYKRPAESLNGFKMKLVQIVFSLLVFALSTQANALELVEYHYHCEVQDSSMQSFISVDSNGKYVIYESPGNNCNGFRSRDTRLTTSLFKTDCEWKDGFVDLLIGSEILAGKVIGQMRVRTNHRKSPVKRYLCKRIQ